jgi:hypothetical protein
MHWLRLIVAALAASELFLRLPILPALDKAREAAMKSARLLPSKRISDHWKERMLPVYARIIATSSLTFFGLLCAALLPVALMGMLDPDGIAAWVSSLLQPRNMLALFVISASYIALRLRFRRG